ncbi:MAG: sigma factor [Bacteroidetes bacterium]|nr:sigma factor [Bacteroidota bacterium]
MTSNNKTTSEIVEHFFRHESARIVSHLCAYFRTNYLEEAEDAVREALIKAMNTWPYQAVPKNPAAWILTVARNK